VKVGMDIEKPFEKGKHMSMEFRSSQQWKIIYFDFSRKQIFKATVIINLNDTKNQWKNVQ